MFLSWSDGFSSVFKRYFVQRLMITNTQRLLAVTISLILVVGVTPAFAQEKPSYPESLAELYTPNVAPDHVEVGDAGSLPDSAQAPGGSGPLNSIAGTLNAQDDEDMWKICITDHNAFSALANANFDEMLALFDEDGLGVYFNDDTGAIFGDSLLPAGDPNSPQAVGTYYLAISQFSNFPTSVGGDIFIGGFLSIGTPTGPGGASPVTGWQDNNVGGTQSYDLFLTGVSGNGCDVVGGELLPIDSTALLIAGAQTNAVWIMSALAVIGSIAFGALYITSKRN